MEYLVDKKGSLKGLFFSIMGVKYLVISTSGNDSPYAWYATHTIKRLDTKELRSFRTHEMKKWMVTILKYTNE